MSWEKVTDFKAQVKVGDTLRIHTGYSESLKGTVTGIGVCGFLLQDSLKRYECYINFDNNIEVFRKPKRWRAGEGYIYYHTDMQHTVARGDWRLVEDNLNYKHGNYFETKEQAEEAARRIREVLKQYHNELDGGGKE